MRKAMFRVIVPALDAFIPAVCSNGFFGGFFAKMRLPHCPGIS